jgi:hypothetical protein
MRKATAARRLAVLKLAGVAGVLATAAIATGTANAQVFIIPGTLNTATNATALSSAITQANTNGGSNTIVIGQATFAPSAAFPDVASGDNLTLTSDHSFQAAAGTASPIISGVNDPSDAPIWTVDAGGSLTTEAIQFRSMGQNGGSFPGLVDNGTMNIYNSAISTNQAEAALQINAGGTASLFESLVSDNAGEGLDNEGGTLNLNNVSIVKDNGGVVNAGTTNMTNTIVSGNSASATPNCTSPMNSSDHSVDSDGSCVAPGDSTTVKGVTQTVGSTRTNGGPTTTDSIPATASGTNPALGLGNPLTCEIVDQRFFPHTTSGCDAGSYQASGAQSTAAVSCPGPGNITTNGTGQNVSQQITVMHGTGFGPEGGLITDPSNAESGMNPGNDQANAIDGVTIDNGTVATSAFSSSGPSTSPLQVTATKQTIGTVTHWSFYATAWNGVTTFCH